MLADVLLSVRQTHNVVIFLGNDADKMATRVPTAIELAQQQQPAAKSLVTTLNKLPRFAQTQLLAAWLQDGEPGDLHKAIAAVPTLWFMTAAIDGRLATALTNNGKQPNKLVTDEDVAARHAGQPDILKLTGDASQVGKLVLTSTDFRNMPDDGRFDLYARALDWLEKHPMILVGCDPSAGSDFERWVYGHLLEILGAFGNQAWLIWENAVQADVDKWAQRGVKIIDAEPVTFLTELGDQLRQDQFAVVDPAVEHLQRLAALFAGQPSLDEIKTAVQTIPKKDRPQTITINLTLDVDATQTLTTAVDIRYTPDIGINYDPKEKLSSGLALDFLSQWARQAEKDRNNGFAPDEDKGRQIFNTIIPANPSNNERRAKYQQALLLNRTLPAQLRMVITLQDAFGRLWSLPWGLLHDGDVPGLEAGVGGRGFLGLNYPLYRWIKAATSGSRATGNIQKALIIAADPAQTLTKLDEEMAKVKQILTAQNIIVTVVQPDDPRLDDLAVIRQLINQEEFHLFHFMGHGQFDEFDPELSGLKLGTAGNDTIMTLTSLQQIAQDNRHLKMIFFSACMVGQAAEQDPTRPWEEAGVVTGMLRAGVPTAVAMRWNIEDEASETLVRVFYQALFQGDQSASIEQAVMLARQELHRLDKIDWSNPILCKKHDAFVGAA